MPWEIKFIQALQSFDSAPILYFNKAMTSLGEVYFFLVFLSVSWVIAPRRFSIHFTFLLLFTVLVNTVLKEIFLRPRPFVLNPHLQLFAAEGYSFPSGHSQIAVVFWGYLAYYVRNKRFTILCLALMLFIGISRTYLGVHYPTDVLSGWFMGLVCLALYFASQNFWQQYHKTTAIFFVVAAMISVQFFHTELLVPALGGLVGTIIGCYLAAQYLNFTLATSKSNNILRIAVSIIGTLLLYFCGKEFFPRTDMIRFVHYALILLWMSFMAPKLCCWKGSND
ncbi:phosphatase PAP2 family protein [Candidatus Uabimicrobium amorphum]|uniref:Phosphatase n=1 Tax=Uabimicrobium amorphum TaxID=2596890 RepID=A0A5S9IJG6_UABAM|nr:phosphatase PAP2 family protein [Candidatus Uabimicrobium amorphum]BBM81745.1 phosphatase [Candidatus Uabimicrobium amorphum]